MKKGDIVKALFTDDNYYECKILKIEGDNVTVSDGNDKWVALKSDIKVRKIVDKPFDVSSFFDMEEKATKLNSVSVATSIDPKTMISTDILCLDLILGGGLKAGRWYDFVGPESSGKTTALYHVLGSAVRHIPNNLKGIFEDLEGQIDFSWFSNITKQDDLDSVFGKRIDGGEWDVIPKLRYYKPAFGERGLQFIKKALKRMPDKVRVNDTWFYMFAPSTAKNVSKAGGYGTRDLQTLLKGKYNSDLFKSTGNFYVEIPNNYAGPELLIGIDSWAAMTPEAIAEDNSDALGGQARMFSKYCNDIKSLIAAKGCTLVGINQAREKPMCLHYKSNILLSDGTTEYLGKIVNQKMKASVMSYNFKTKKFEPKPIVKWHNNGKAEQGEFFNIKVASGKKNGHSTLKVTKEHVLYTLGNKEIKAGKVRVGDTLLTKINNIPVGDSLQVVLGSILGDGSLSCSETETGSLRHDLSIWHSEHQEGYCKAKEAILASGYPGYNRHNQYGFNVSIKGSTICKKIYNESYDYSGETLQRRFSQKLADKIDIRGIAIWYMDDGQIAPDYYKFLAISVQQYTDEDVYKLCNMICKVTNLPFEVYIKQYETRTTKLIRLRDRESIQKFLSLIGPYMLSKKEMCYKLGKFNVKNTFSYPWEINSVSKLRACKVVEISELPNNQYPTRFDIEVEGNHNYIADDLLVHNSMGDPEYYPGGNALKHACDCRARFGAVSNQNGSGPVEYEGDDSYRWAKVKTKKNKVFIPYKETRIRWWTEMDGESGCGCDPVFDTLEYLKLTKQYKGTKRGFTINFKGNSSRIRKINEMDFTYDDFKESILDGKLGIRDLCFKQLGSGKGVELYLNNVEEE